MTLKNAVAELPFGGAKSVILDTGAHTERSALMRRFGTFVARSGAYVPGVDMGTTVQDLAWIGEAGAAAIRAAVAHVDAREGVDAVRDRARRLG